jgi:hypothetical protein
MGHGMSCSAGPVESLASCVAHQIVSYLGYITHVNSLSIFNLANEIYVINVVVSLNLY